MAVFKRRNRTVNFRLSDEEFETLRKACLAEGARSLSDFARSVVCRSIGSPSERYVLDENMRRIDTRLEMLHREIRELSETIGAGPVVRRAGD